LEAAHTHHHAHTHTHPHTQTKAVLNRMARLIGHMQSVRRMVEDGRDCSEVLLQLSAVDAALKNVGKIILKDHMEHCIIDAVQNDDREALARLEQAIDRFVR
jgi:DNA-binding FrmR family transcriptional regulator